MLREYRGYLRLPRVVVERLHMNGALRRRDLAIHSPHSHVSSVRSAEHKTKASTYTEIDLADHQRPPARAEPSLEQFRLAEGGKNHLTWGIKYSRHDNFPIGGSSDFQSSRILHRCFPLLAFRARFAFSFVFISSSKASSRWK